MDLRLRNLEQLDARAVPLPHGTEVVTRLDRIVSDAAALIERKRAGERVGLDPALLEAWRPRIDALFLRLDLAKDASDLPEEPGNEAEIRDWLLRVRRQRFTGPPPASSKIKP